MTKAKLIQTFFVRAGQRVASYWRASWWHKTWLLLVLIILLILGAMYGIAQWYKASTSHQPLVLGVTFDPDYASYLGLNPQQTLAALEGIGIKHFRFTSYWSDIEPEPGKYDFSQLDWEFASARQHHASVSLSIGLRQPRWPECHAPNWVDANGPSRLFQPALVQFMTKVVDRYKNNPALASYQLENEYFNKFGQCQNSDRQRLVAEYNLVRQLDPKHPIITNRSNNFPNLPTGQPRPAEFGEEIYRTVWSPPINRYFTYPMPAWYYGFLAGATKIATGRNSILTEVQAEPWPRNGKNILDTSLAEQNKTMNAKIFTANAKFAESTGIRTIYFWGAEYWYYRWQILHDKSVWNAAKAEFRHSG